MQQASDTTNYTLSYTSVQPSINSIVLRKGNEMKHKLKNKLQT